MPVAVIGPAGASLADSRQLSAGSERNLSCTKFASTCSGVPSSPDFTSRIASWIGGSKRFSWPTASLTPFSLHAAIDLNTSARDIASGFSQNTCFFAPAARRICSVCSVCGVHSTTPWTFGSFSTSSKVASGTPWARAKSAAFGSGSTTFTTLSLALVLMSGTMMRPHHPSPVTATFMLRPYRSRLLQRYCRFTRSVRCRVPHAHQHLVDDRVPGVVHADEELQQRRGGHAHLGLLGVRGGGECAAEQQGIGEQGKNDVVGPILPVRAVRALRSHAPDDDHQVDD